MDKFCTWEPWAERNSIENIHFPGVYVLAISDINLARTKPNWSDNIIYIGMSNSKRGVKGRLLQFENTINRKVTNKHGGADRVLYKHRNYNKLVNRLYASVRTFPCSVENKAPEDLLQMGEVVKMEYVALAHFKRNTGNLPEFNRRTSKKHSLTVGRGKEKE